MRSTGSIHLRFFDYADQPFPEVRRRVTAQTLATFSCECVAEWTVDPDFADAVSNSFWRSRVYQDGAVADLLTDSTNIGCNYRAPKSPGFEHWDICWSKKCRHYQGSSLCVESSHVFIGNIAEIQDLRCNLMLIRCRHDFLQNIFSQ